MKHQIDIQIQLIGYPSRNKYPELELLLNHQLIFSGEVVNTQSFSFVVDTDQDLNSLEIVHKNKTNQDTIVNADGTIVEDRSVELKELTINGQRVKDTVLYDSPFYVEWPDNILEDYKDKSQVAPEFIKNTLYFGFNGRYVHQFLSDCRREHFRQLWLDEVQSHQNQQIIEDGTEKFSRYGEKISICQEFDLTIFDLNELIHAEN